MTDSPKSILMGQELHEYIVAHGTPPDALQQELIDETRKNCGGLSIMQIAPEQGALMMLLARLMGARRAIEIGTFTGYSAMCIARALPRDGELICCDVNREWTDIAERYWKRDGVSDRISLRIGPALETLRELPLQRDFDLAFVDADKPSYRAYVEELVLRVRVGGLILLDNVLWMGRVIDPDADDDNTIAIKKLNDELAEDTRFERVMLPVSDGLTLLRLLE